MFILEPYVRNLWAYLLMVAGEGEGDARERQ